ncbi:MAG: hypothetical protein HRT58_09120 [Crocinitomicaceae bacterium]|nr:hypothetical protein [Flavobacteriales bacterium]NQZ35813.1 hypothetical protein [Crocinitomicaceae bacterium]
MKKRILLLGSFLAILGTNFAQNVGIAEPAPNSKLDIVQTETSGNTIEVSNAMSTNGSSSVWIKNGGAGYGINTQNLLATSNSAVGRFFQLGTGSSAHGVLVNMDGTTVATATGLFIDQSGLGLGSYVTMGNAASASSGYYVTHSGSGDGMTIFQNGTGIGIYNQVATSYGVFNVINSSAIGTINLMTAGGTGEYIDLATFDGTGVQVIAVNNTTTPTAGGDVFALYADVRTSTATTGTVFGSVIAGNQYGVGHGILINHSGASGRNAEFSLLNAANTEAVFFAAHMGQGSAVLAQNQSNVIVGTINVGDFSYTGTDVADHIGVNGSSVPAAGWGVGVHGQGGWFGVFSTGDLSATGVKAFTIDHPEDPANKMLKHFAIESNEVLNMYRGVIELDGSGQATVELPDYFELININFSYQLTAIGTPQQPYVLTEIQGNTFEVAGAPNSKVSWVVYADRNDAYLQQNPEKAQDVVLKTGERQGKYLNPELYGMPESSAMFPKTAEQSGTQINSPQSTIVDEVRQKALNTQEVQMESGNNSSLEQ